MKQIQLTPAQQHYKEAIKWLTSSHINTRRVGKSFIIALCLIEEAMEKPGIWIGFWDHGPNHPRKNDFMLSQIINIVEEYFPDWQVKHKLSTSVFSLKKKDNK